MNIIKVKIVDSEGNLKGRAYTYKSETNVSVGDLVVADMGGSDKVLQVVATGLPAAEIAGLDYEIKTIKGLLPEGEDLPETEGIGLKFEIVEETAPVIKINFEEMKMALSTALEKYKGLVVTEQTLGGCKATQKELAGVRVKIDNYRKEKKKELSAPIAAFEGQCKDLIAAIESVEQPIKSGIALFDDRKKDGKRQDAEVIRLTVIEETGLRQKYADKLTVIDKYCNLTAKKSEVKDDLESRAFALKVEQDREDELLDIIKDTIAAENQRITKQLGMDDFERLIGLGLAAKDIIVEVRKRAQVIYDAEHPAPKPEPVKELESAVETMSEVPAEEIATESINETYVMDAPVNPVINDPECYGTYRITAKLSELRAVSAYLKEHGLAYTVLEQGEL